MSKILVLAEHRQGQLKKATSELLGISAGLDTVAIIFGSDAKPAAEELAAKGVKTVYWVSSKDYDQYHPEAYAAALEDCLKSEGSQFLLGTGSSLGKDLVPKIAARFDSPLLADCVELKWTASGVEVKRPFFSGKALGTLESVSSPLVCVTLRANSYPAGKVSESAGSVKEVAGKFEFSSSPLKFVEKTKAVSDRPDLTEANIIISGGRSLKSKDNFKILFDCAETLGAAVGASRAAVDEGLASHDMQVGQTGKTVNPSLYIACGISGAIQHLAGMRTSKVIVAVNKDPNAPIFQKADYGIVGDLFEVVPQLTGELKKLLGKA